MQFTPKVWGPFFWNTMHIVALGYPESPTYGDKRAAKEFFESLQQLIPCKICRDHYRVQLKDKPLTPFLDKRADLFKWTVLIHNSVNKFLERPEWTEHEVITYYKNLGERNRSPIWTSDDIQYTNNRSFVKGMLVGSVGVAAIGGAYIFYKRYYK